MRILSLLTAVVLLTACGRTHVPDTAPEGIIDLPGDVAATTWDVKPLLPGMEAPELELIAADGSTWRMNPSAMERPVILTFYRGGWCPYCNHQRNPPTSELLDFPAEIRGPGS